MIAIVTFGHRPDDERIFGREIRTLLKARYEITYFTRWTGEINLSEDNLWHRNYSQKNISIQDYSQGILKDLKVLKPSVVHIHEFELLPLAKKIKKLYSTKIVYDVHEANIELWDAHSSKPNAIKKIINASLNKYEKSHLKSVDYVFTVTTGLVDRYNKWGVKSVLIPNYPISFPRRSTKSSVQTIVYHGQIALERGVEDLINAIPPLIMKGLSFKVEIYGTERVLGTINRLIDMIAELNLKNTVNIYSQLPHIEMLRVLSKAHIAVIPFRDYPMFQMAIPVKMFEAMWAQCGIVASDMNSIREHGESIVEFYPSGNVEALSQALGKLLLNEKERKRRGALGAKLIKDKYNWKKIEPTLLEVYQRIHS